MSAFRRRALIGSLAVLAAVPSLTCGGSKGGGSQPRAGGPGDDAGVVGQGTPGTPDAGPSAPDEDWPQYRHDVRGSSAAGAVLSAAQATALHEVWSFELGQYAFSQPVRAGDTVYAATAVLAKVHALDVASGALRWTRDLRSPTHSDCGGDDSPGIWASPAIADGTVYVAAPDGAVHAMDPGTGSDRWTAHVADPSPHAELLVTSPAVSQRTRHLYVGVAATAHCDPALGRVAAVDLVTGATEVRTMVDPGQVGAAVWASVSVDEDAGVLYAGTGNPVGDLASEPLAQAIVALDVATLAVLDHWQDPAPLLDCDFGTSPTLMDAGGRSLVAASNKDGWLYVLDRRHLSAGPLWKREIAVGDPADPTRCGDTLMGFGTIVSPVFANGTLYVGGGRTPDGHAGSVVALDPLSGALRFTHVTPGFVLGAMAAAGDVLLVTSNAANSMSSTLEVLDARSGAVLKTFTRPSATFAGVSVSRGGLVLWADFDGHLSALAP